MANACLIHLLTYYTVFPTETVSKTGRNVNEQSSLPSKGFLQNTTAGFNAETNKRNGITLTVLPITILIKQASQTTGGGGAGAAERREGKLCLGTPQEPGPALPWLSPWPVPACLLLWDVEGVVTRATRKNTCGLPGTDLDARGSEHASYVGPDLFLQRHDEDAPDLEETLHVVLVLLLHASPAVHPVVLRTARRDLQAVARDEGRFTEVKPGSRTGFP